MNISLSKSKNYSFHIHGMYVDESVNVPNHDNSKRTMNSSRKLSIESTVFIASTWQRDPQGV